MGGGIGAYLASLDRDAHVGTGKPGHIPAPDEDVERSHLWTAAVQDTRLSRERQFERILTHLVLRVARPKQAFGLRREIERQSRGRPGAKRDVGDRSGGADQVAIAN